MKIRKLGYFLVAVLLIVAMSSCDMINDFIASRTRDLPVIEIYNSNLEKTRKLLPNDTLFVEVGGLKPFDVYEVTCEDPEGKTITVLNAQADENGMISPSPLWYDIGFKRDTGTGKPVLASEAELGLSAFNINVKNVDLEGKTNLTLPFWIVYNTDIARPQPIVMAMNSALELENSFDTADAARNKLYVKVANLKDLPPGNTTATVYIVPYKGTAFLDGDPISPVYLEQEFSVADLKAGVQITEADNESSLAWTNGIPTNAQGKAFSIILDCDNNGRYDVRKDGMADYFLDGIDGNMAPGFVVMNPPQSVAFEPANIASGGKYSWNYSTWTYDYDYRDKFKIEGMDTQYAWDWQFGGYGVKATWNPYISWSPTAGSNMPETPSIYYGTYVDVYIVKRPTPYSGLIEPATEWGLTKLTMPVQYSCYNGCGQQTIWRADGDNDPDNGGLVVGDYDVVVDINRDGNYSDGDIIDNQPQTPNLTTFAPRTGGGFSVVTNY